MGRTCIQALEGDAQMTNDIAKVIGRNLTFALYDAGRMTNKALAERVGVTESMIGHITAGTKVPSLELLMRIADALGTTPGKLMGEAQ